MIPPCLLRYAHLVYYVFRVAALLCCSNAVARSQDNSPPVPEWQGEFGEFAAFVAAVGRHRRTRPLIFWRNGCAGCDQMVLTGAKNEDNAQLAGRKITRIMQVSHGTPPTLNSGIYSVDSLSLLSPSSLTMSYAPWLLWTKQRLGYSNARFSEFKIQNIVGTCDVGFPIQLEGMADGEHGRYSCVREPTTPRYLLFFAASHHSRLGHACVPRICVCSTSQNCSRASSTECRSPRLFY